MKGRTSVRPFFCRQENRMSTAEDSAERLRKAQVLLQSNQLQAALDIVHDILTGEPDNVEALLTVAAAERLQAQHEKAKTTLNKLLKLKPGFGRAFQEIGFNELSTRNLVAAGRAFENAVQADPALLPSWRVLAKLYHDSGQTEETANAQEKIAFLESLPAELLTVHSYLAEDRLEDAERLCRYFLQSNKTHVEGMRLLAEIATRGKVLDDAEFLLESCVNFEPDHRNARFQYANVLLKQQKFAKAHEQATLLKEKYGGELEQIDALYASACMGLGLHDDAKAAYQQLMQNRPDNHLYPVSMGHILKTDGDIDGAVALYQQAYQTKPDFGDAYWSLANAKSYQFTDTEMQSMASYEASDNTAIDDRVQLCFALGKAFEDRGDFASAFEHYDRGNALKKSITHHHPKPLQARVDSQIDVCTAEFLESKQGLGIDDSDPIFIVGLPRAGSTLLEQILSSHSQVDGTMELHNILNLAKRLRGRSDEADGTPRYPKVLTELDDSYFARFGQQFIDDTRAYRGEAPYFIDKMPNNFFHVGLIRLIMPNAKVVDARRHPMACCFSGFKQLFGEGQEFSYSLTDIGNYYRQYVRLMDHWDKVLPGYVLRVQYEDVVADLETQVRRMLDFCGLDFEPACLEYHKTERSIRTPSAEQVRQPIYQSGLEQWRNFAPWLDPLTEALGDDVLSRYPID